MINAYDNGDATTARGCMLANEESVDECEAQVLPSRSR